MLRICTFGSLHAALDGANLDWLLSRRKPAALLIYLAVEREATRDRILSIFWPDTASGPARHALNQTLHQLRRALGAPHISTSGELIRIGSEVHCDVADFEGTVAAGNVVAACQLYCGHFLDGVHLVESWAFEEWVARRRAVLEAAHRTARRELVQRQLASGGVDDALASMRAWVALDEWNDEAHHLLIEVLAEQGQRGEALRQYQDYAKRLEKEELSPPAPMVALFEELRAANGTAPMAIIDVPRPPSIGRGTITIRAPQHNRRLHHGALFAAVALLLFGAAYFTLGTSRSSPAGRFDILMVAPFRVIGADSSQENWDERVVHLLSTDLAKGAAADVVDARATIAAWRRSMQTAGREWEETDAVELAAGFGAGRALLGEIHFLGTDRIGVTARLIRVRDGRTIAEHQEFARGDVTPLVRRVIGRLFAAANGEDPVRVLALSESEMAMSAYHAGMDAYHRNQHDSAMLQLTRALDIDSTFAVAALWRALTAAVLPANPGRAPAVDAWRLRHRLSGRDRLLIAGMYSIGPNYPEPSTLAELIHAQQLSAHANPDRPEAWWQWGAHLQTFGAYAGVPHSVARGAAALDSALSLAGEFGIALEFRLLAALDLNDASAIRRFGAAHLARSPNAPEADLYRWLIATELGDRTRLTELRARFATFSDVSVDFMPGHSIVQGVPLRDAALAVAVKLKQSPSPERKQALFASAIVIAAARGRVASVRELTDSLLALGDLEGAMTATLLGIAEPAFQPRPSVLEFLDRMATTASTLEARVNALCYAELARTFAGDTSRTRATSSRIRELVRDIDPAPFPRVGRQYVCPLLLEAALEQLQPGRHAAPALDQLEARMRAGPGYDLPGSLANLMIARWRSQRGEHASALAAVRRRVRGWQHRQFAILDPIHLREEGRLAELVGDTAGALGVWQHFLVLRDDPDSPALARDVAHVRSRVSQIRSTSSR